jgi:hypothetical protein
VHHLGGDVHGAFARDEDDAAPVLTAHTWQIQPRKTHAAEHVDFKEAQPVGIGNLFERLRIEDSQIVDENIDVGKRLRQRFGNARLSQVSGVAVDVLLCCLCNRGASAIHRRLKTAVDDHARAFGRQHLRDRQANAGCASGNECALVPQLQIHV